MTSDRPDTKAPEEAYVWIWLPGATAPVVAGRIARDGERLIFNYGQSYLDRKDRIPIYEPELPLRNGAIAPEAGLSMAGCLRDAAPDAWGRRVILNRTFGRKGKDVDTAALDELTYLLESGSDRIGALDFQHSPSEYVPRAVSAGFSNGASTSLTFMFASFPKSTVRCVEASMIMNLDRMPVYRFPEGDNPVSSARSDHQSPQ